MVLTPQEGSKINASKNIDDDAKMFVGGLSWETTRDDLVSYFSQFGELLDATIKVDPTTGRSRCFGFILFKDGSSVSNVESTQGHTLNGKAIDPKRAKARGGREPIRKIFVGGINPELPEDDLKAFFSHFGEIEEIEWPINKETNRRRGFAFITYRSGESVEIVCRSQYHNLGKTKVEVKKAIPKEEQQAQAAAAQSAAAFVTVPNSPTPFGYAYAQPYPAYGASLTNYSSPPPQTAYTYPHYGPPIAPQSPTHYSISYAPPGTSTPHGGVSGPSTGQHYTLSYQSAAAAGNPVTGIPVTTYDYPSAASYSAFGATSMDPGYGKTPRGKPHHMAFHQYGNDPR